MATHNVDIVVEARENASAQFAKIRTEAASLIATARSSGFKGFADSLGDVLDKAGSGSQTFAQTQKSLESLLRSAKGTAFADQANQLRDLIRAASASQSANGKPAGGADGLKSLVGQSSDAVKQLTGSEIPGASAAQTFLSNVAKFGPPLAIAGAAFMAAKAAANSYAESLKQLGDLAAASAQAIADGSLTTEQAARRMASAAKKEGGLGYMFGKSASDAWSGVQDAGAGLLSVLTLGGSDLVAQAGREQAAADSRKLLAEEKKKLADAQLAKLRQAADDVGKSEADKAAEYQARMGGDPEAARQAVNKGDMRQTTTEFLKAYRQVGMTPEEQRIEDLRAQGKDVSALERLNEGRKQRERAFGDSKSADAEMHSLIEQSKTAGMSAADAAGFRQREAGMGDGAAKAAVDFTNKINRDSEMYKLSVDAGNAGLTEREQILKRLADEGADPKERDKAAANLDRIEQGQREVALHERLKELLKDEATAGMDAVEAAKKRIQLDAGKPTDARAKQDIKDAQAAIQTKADKDQAKQITDAGKTPAENALKNLQDAFRLNHTLGEDGNPLLSDKAFERRKKQINEDLTKGAIGVDNTADEGRFTSGLGARLGRQDPVVEAMQKVSTKLDEANQNLGDMLKQLEDLNGNAPKQVAIQDLPD